MPTYEYRCPKGHDFEKFYRSISVGPSELECPVCGAIGKRQLSAGAGLHFKGSGFYITDYGKDGKKAQPTSADSSKSEKSDKSEKAEQSDKSEKAAKSEKTESSPSSADKPKSGSAEPKVSKPAEVSKKSETK